MHWNRTWQLAVELVPWAKGEAEHVGEVLLHPLDDLHLQPSHGQAHEQGSGLGAPHPTGPPAPLFLPAGAEELSDAQAAALSYSKAQIITNLRIGVM